MIASCTAELLQIGGLIPRPIRIAQQSIACSHLIEYATERERDMPEATLPAVVLVLCSERGRSERAGPRGVSTARSTLVSSV
jgi:hypothetical protein